MTVIRNSYMPHKDKLSKDTLRFPDYISVRICIRVCVSASWHWEICWRLIPYQVIINTIIKWLRLLTLHGINEWLRYYGSCNGFSKSIK